MEQLVKELTSVIKLWIKKYENVTGTAQFPNLEQFRNDHPQFTYDDRTCLLLETLIGREFCKLILGQS